MRSHRDLVIECRWSSILLDNIIVTHPEHRFEAYAFVANIASIDSCLGGITHITKGTDIGSGEARLIVHHHNAPFLDQKQKSRFHTWIISIIICVLYLELTVSQNFRIPKEI